MRADILSEAAVLAMLVTSAAVHEAGHLLTARLAGIPVRRMKLCGIGAVISFDFSRTTYLREAAVHLGGAAFGMVSAVLAYAVLGSRAEEYLGMTAVLSAVNLLPVRGLDGGGALLALLSMVFLPDTAVRIAGWVSVFAWSVLWCAAIRLGLRGTYELWPIVFAAGVMLMYTANRGG